MKPVEVITVDALYGTVWPVSSWLFLFVQISKVLLCIAIPGDEDSLYQYVDQLKDRQL